MKSWGTAPLLHITPSLPTTTTTEMSILSFSGTRPSHQSHSQFQAHPKLAILVSSLQNLRNREFHWTNLGHCLFVVQLAVASISSAPFCFSSSVNLLPYRPQPWLFSKEKRVGVSWADNPKVTYYRFYFLNDTLPSGNLMHAYSFPTEDSQVNLTPELHVTAFIEAFIEAFLTSLYLR